MRLGRAQLQQQNALDVLKIVRRSRDNRLVHGNIKLNNFVLTKWSELYLIELPRSHQFASTSVQL
ncbi:MAG: hypothetical protein ACXVH6_06730 [Halobacteriota archaeon]